MSDISFSDVKIHNEIELFSVSDTKVKRQLEHLFLENRISYFEKWEDASFFRRFFWGSDRSTCTFCVNEMQVERAMQIVKDRPAIKERVNLVGKRVNKMYF